MPDTADPRKSRALARLQASRQALQGLDATDEPVDGKAPPSLWRALVKTPGIAHVMDVIKVVWADSPLRLPTQMAGRQWRQVMSPVVREHPLACMTVAAVAGFAIVRHRQALLDLATGTLWPKVSPSAQAAMQSMLGVAASALLERCLNTASNAQAQPDAEA